MKTTVAVLYFVVSFASACAMGHVSPDAYPDAEHRLPSPGNTTYYIDPARGNDRHSGTSGKLAWRSFRRINRLRLAAGDCVKIIAPGKFDQTLMLVGTGTAQSPVRVSFAAGRYDFHPDRALGRKYQISNTNGAPDESKAIGILLEDARHFRLTGPGATIVYRGKMIEVCLDRCEDIRISDLRFDYHRPTVSEFAVAAEGDGYVDLKIHKDSQYRIDHGQITWQGEGWSYQTGLAQELDLKTDEVWRRRDPLKGLTFEELKPYLVRARGKHGMKPGRVYQLRNTHRDGAGVFTRRSKNITWKNVTFHYLHGMGLVNQFSENLTFDSVTIAPDEKSGRTTAGWADGIQVSGCRGKIRVKNCVFTGLHDDAINIHGTYLRVVEQLSDTKIKVRFMHNQTFGFMAFNPGDEIEFVRWDSLKTFGPNTVKTAELINPTDMVLTLAKPVPSDIREMDAVENVTWTPEVEIRGCTVKRIPTRGFLVATRRKVLVEDNDFHRTHMSAILVAGDAKSWFESGCVRDMTIRGNRFLRCAEPVVNLNPQNSVSNDAVHRNVRVENNTFLLRRGTAVRAKSTGGLRVTGNTLYADGKIDDRSAVQTTDSSDVKVQGNRYLPTAQYRQPDPLVDHFRAPPAATRPGCYWYWINDNINKAGLTEDLEAMTRVGIGRAYIGHIFNHNGPNDTPVGKVPFMSDAWWDAVQWAVKEADRCGVEIGFFNSPGWSQSGGPWVKPSQSMRYLAQRETVIVGGKRIDRIIPAPEVTTFPMAGGSRPTPTGPKFTEADYQEVRVIAFRQTEPHANDIDMKQVKAAGRNIKDVAKLFDGSPRTFAAFPHRREVVIDLTLPDLGKLPSGVQSVFVNPLDTRYTLRCRVECSADGKTYRKIADYSEQRGHQGPLNTDPIAIPFPPTKAKHLRLTFETTGQARFSEIRLSRRAVLGGYVRKQLGETDPAIKPRWDAYVWRSQAAPADGSAVVSDNVIDLTDKMDSTGRLRWDAPEGRWVVVRMGMIPIGTQCAPSSPQSRGLEVDKMNRQHVRALFDGMVGEFLRRTPAKDRKALKYIIADSYETGPQNWTDGLIDRFTRRFGYSPVRYLPAMTGRIVDSPEVSDRFLWDLRRLIVEKIAYDYVGGLRDVCNENDLTLWLENYGHWGYPSEFLLYGSQSNQVGGEFWVGGVRDNVECRAASSCGRTYGMNAIYAESFTSGHNFKHSPASLKKWCDWLFGTGVNHLILHVNIHQTQQRKPGIIQWFGTSFNRYNTWFEQCDAFIDYMRRSGVLLKAGRPVIDVAYYIGENAPMMTGPRDPALPDGYDYDFINSDVLINRARVEDGRLVVPNGPAYAVLVLPKQKVMRPEVARAIERLIQSGAAVLGPKPATSPSLENYPACDRAVAQIADRVWSHVDGKTVTKRQCGEGWIYDGVTLEQVFADLGLAPDVAAISDRPVLCAASGAGKMGVGNHGGIVYQHRAEKDREIYFLANTSNAAVDFTASLRCAGRSPALWNAATGKIKYAAAFTRKDGRTWIPLRLEPSESIFVVFGEKIGESVRGAAKTNEPGYTPLATLDGKWTVRFAGQGAPEKITFDTLTDWTKHTNEAIRHYSGTAVYEKSFTLDKPTDKPVVLEMGNAGVIATVYLNGKQVGRVWTTPWRIDITDYAVDGQNELQIHVTNIWNNRLVADAKLQPDKRRTYVSQNYRFDPREALYRSGLFGPVRILAESEPGK